MNFIRNFFSSIIIILVIPLLLVVTITFTLNRTVLSEGFIKGQVEKNNLYQGIAGFAQSSLGQQTEDPRMSEILSQSITAERVKEAVEPVLTKVFDYIHERSDDTTITIDFRPIKADIKARVPKDSQKEIDAAFPDDLKIGSDGGEQSGPPSWFAQARSFKRGSNRLSQLLPWVILGLFGLLAMINTGGGRLRRPAYVFLIVGLIVGGLGGIVVWGIPLAVSNLGNMPGLPEVAKTSINDFAHGLGGGIAREILIAGGAYVALAILLFVASIFIHSPAPAAAPKEQQTFDPKRATIKH